MKKTILHVLGLCCFCFGAKAQFNKGDVLLGGNLGINTSSVTPAPNNSVVTKSSNILVNPTIGFFKNEKSLYSFGVIYGHSSYEYATINGSQQKNNGNSYGFNFSKQCFMPIVKNFYFVFGGGISALYADNKTTYYQTNTYSTDKSGQFTIALQPGVTYKLNKKILFDIFMPNMVSANYVTGTQHYVVLNGSDTKGTSNSFSLATNLNSNLFNNLSFGERFLLNQKSK